MAWSATVGCTVGAAGLVLWLASHAGVAARDGVGALLIYFAIAPRDLVTHGGAVQRALAAGDLTAARRRVAMMVSRDTETLDAAGVARATVESVAENLVDAVTAPLFWALVLGPLGAVAYRAINTLDAMFGYRNARYRQFGWAAARADDVANWLPARLTAPLLVLAAPLVGGEMRRAWRILRRDGRRHSSPNSGLSEAAAAGALGVQLGGVGRYFGQEVHKPTLGDARRPLEPGDIGRANRLCLAAAALFLLLGLSARLLLAPGGTP